ncbi:MAG: TetR/AcrR family transcriptional regulator [Chloroflexi bacterium]|nr:TetR/AcrR family transcriptional regulator [Chloroflexota bacterium]
MPTYAKSTVTIANIFQAAEGLFTSKNYADVTMSHIAQAANVTKGALYHHFSGKEDLYLRMMHNFLDEIHALTADSVQNSATRPCRQRLHCFTLSFLTLPDIQQKLMRLVRRDINTFTDPEREVLVRAYQRALPEQAETIIRDGIANGEIEGTDARLLSWEHVAIVEVVLRPYAQNALGDPQNIADFVIKLFFDGVGRCTFHYGN